MSMHIFRLTLILLLCAVTIGCASNQQAQQQANNAQAEKDPRDPLESINRPLWDFNYNILDRYLLRPVTVGYMTVVPKPARKGLVNVMDNLSEPASFLNSLLQGKPDKAMISAGRFLVNSTVGILGLFDVATGMGLAEQDEDFNQTLAVWGLSENAYLMLPAAGPTTVRGTIGGAVDNFYFPFSLLNTPLTIARFVIKGLDGREQLMSMEQILEDSLDPYSFVKEAYFQNQIFKIYDGNPPQQEEYDDSYLDEYLD